MAVSKRDFDKLAKRVDIISETQLKIANAVQGQQKILEGLLNAIAQGHKEAVEQSSVEP